MKQTTMKQTWKERALIISMAKALNSEELVMLANALEERYCGTKQALAAARDAVTLRHTAHMLRRWPWSTGSDLSDDERAHLEALVDKVLRRWRCGIKYEL